MTVKIDRLSKNTELLNNDPSKKNGNIEPLNNSSSKKYKNTELIININKNEKEIGRLNYGNKILFIGTYEEPEERRNYKGFSYKEYLKTKGIYGTVIVDNIDEIKVIKKYNLDLIHLCINKLSQKFNNNLKNILPLEKASLAKGVLLSDSTEITDEIKNNFKYCNLSHMLAVSGSHLAYLTLGLNLILNKKILGIRNTKNIKIIIIIIFMMITNMSPSVVRAGISVILVLIATMIKRKADTYTTISFATLCTLIQNPFSIFNIGMQLSYLGTIGILLFSEKIQNYLERKLQKKLNLEEDSGFVFEINRHMIKNIKKSNIENKINTRNNIDKINTENNTDEKNKDSLPKIIYTKITTYIIKIKKYIIQSISVTLSANILIFPLTIYNFNTISLNFIISNLIASPILGLCIILGLLTLLISIISMPLAKILAIPLNLFLNLLIKITNLISKIPMSNITVVTPHIITIIAIYIGIFMFCVAIQNKERARSIIKQQFDKTRNNKTEKSKIVKFVKDKFPKTLCTIILILIISTNILAIINTNRSLKLYFIDVGQGDSSLICTSTGKNILIDGGGNRNPEKYDVGEKVLVPYLLDRRIKKLDYIIVSHFDADHAQGLEAVIKNINVKNIVISKQASICSEYEKIMGLCKKRKIKVIVAKRGGKIQIDKYTYFDILHPGDKMLDDGKGGLNANAIVAKLYCKTNKKNKMLSISTMLNENNSSSVNGKINDKIKINGSSKYFTILFTGDIEEDAEQELVKVYGEKLKSDILKVAHHGSKTSSTTEFLQAVSPRISLIGVGKDNTFGHPNEGVIERLKSIKTKIFRTDINGEITIEIS